MRWLVASVLFLTGCTYGPPEYRGRISNATALGDGRVALTYTQIVIRPPTGLATFPDGGSPIILHDQMLVATVDQNGATRELARFPNRAIPGNGSIWVKWSPTDPSHLYVTLGGQLNTDNPLRWRSDTIRMDLDGKQVAAFDLRSELKQRDREFGAKLFGGERIMDAAGTLLVGATNGETQEVWRRDPDGRWSMLDGVETSVSLVGPDLVYFQGSEQFARNWRTGAVRRIAYFDPVRRQRIEPNPSDPALRPPTFGSGIRASVSPDGKTVEINRDNERIGIVQPDLNILDRR